MPSILFNAGSSQKLMSVAEAAYMAGFVDGEGCLTIGRAKRAEHRTGFSYEALMTIGNTNLDVLHHILRLCGNGKIQVSDKRNELQHRTMYRIVFSANQIRHVLPQLRAFLVVKAQQADVVLEFLAGRTAGRNVTLDYWRKCEELRSKVRTLNKRGLVDTAPSEIIVREDVHRAPRLCGIDGCSAKHYAKGFCFPHYYRQVMIPRRLAAKQSKLVEA